MISEVKLFSFLVTNFSFVNPLDFATVGSFSIIYIFIFEWLKAHVRQIWAKSDILD